VVRLAAAGQIVIEEVVNITAALDAGVAVEAVYVRSSDTPPLELAETPIVQLAPAAYDALFPDTRVPRVFALARRPAAVRPKHLAARDGDLVVLDGVSGPGNIGSVIRLAAAFDAAGVILLDVAPPSVYRRGVIRAASGAIFQVPVLAMRADDWCQFCHRNQRTIVTTSPHHGEDVRDVGGVDERLAIVFGGESRGVSPALRASAGRELHIPMPGPVESLNVAAAVAIVLFTRSLRQ
jgi:TrmH family RNA methyltransferase